MRDNGNLPAFPTHTKEGLSKREWLIGMIAQGLAANPDYVTTSCDLVAQVSVLQADALLIALEANTEPEVHLDV